MIKSALWPSQVWDSFGATVTKITLLSASGAGAAPYIRQFESSVPWLSVLHHVVLSARGWWKYRITESWKRPSRSSSPTTNLTYQVPSLKHVPQHHACTYRITGSCGGGAGGEGLLWGVRWQWTGFTAVCHIPVSLHWVFRSSLDVMSAGGVCLKDRVLAGCRSERAC